MDQIFIENCFLLKRKGLSIAGKYILFDAEGKNPLLFIEEKSKWFPPSITYRAYADEKKTREVLTLKDRPDDPSENMDVFDAQSGEKIGSLISDADSFSEIFKDVWKLCNADGKVQAKVYEKSLSKSL
ncbi:MAG: hypothetical protein C0410_15520, partial [Anaerolinea sp.]|nr:hypothetical protein [Anaerolinea sp.]